MTHKTLLRGTLVVGLGLMLVAGCSSRPLRTVQLSFEEPKGMQVSIGGQHLELPTRVVLEEGSTTLIVLSNIPDRPDMVIQAEVIVSKRIEGMFKPEDPSANFRERCAIPIRFEGDDFDQTMANNLITKVVYLPHAENQELAFTGTSVLEPDVLISTRLEPGEDPIVEAQRLGTILAVIRMGNRF